MPKAQRDARHERRRSWCEHIAHQRAASCSACASSTPPASWRTPPALGSAKRDLARALTVARQRGIDVERELSD